MQSLPYTPPCPHTSMECGNGNTSMECGNGIYTHNAVHVCWLCACIYTGLSSDCTNILWEWQVPCCWPAEWMPATLGRWASTAVTLSVVLFSHPHIVCFLFSLWLCGLKLHWQLVPTPIDSCTTDIYWACFTHDLLNTFYIHNILQLHVRVCVCVFTCLCDLIYKLFYFITQTFSGIIDWFCFHWLVQNLYAVHALLTQWNIMVMTAAVEYSIARPDYGVSIWWRRELEAIGPYTQGNSQGFFYRAQSGSHVHRVTSVQRICQYNLAWPESFTFQFSSAAIIFRLRTGSGDMYVVCYIIAVLHGFWLH